MTSLKKDMRKHFETENLYELLMLTKDASDDEIKRAYRKLSLKIHPDRVALADVELATIKFQILGKVHSVLSDKKRRKIYDETGIADDDLISDKVSDWTKYFDSIFKKVELQDIVAFEKEYLESDEEAEDLKKLYLRFKGNMNVIMEHLMFYQFEYEDRYRKIIKDLIKKKEVPDYKIFTQESAKSLATRKKKCEAEAKAAVKHEKKMKKADDGNDLVKMIRQRQQDGQSLADRVANSLGLKVPMDKKEDSSDEEDDEEEDDDEVLSGDDVDKSESESESEEDDDEETARPSRSKKSAVRGKISAPKNAKAPAAKRRRYCK